MANISKQMTASKVRRMRNAKTKHCSWMERGGFGMLFISATCQRFSDTFTHIPAWQPQAEVPCQSDNLSYTYGEKDDKFESPVSLMPAAYSSQTYADVHNVLDELRLQMDTWLYGEGIAATTLPTHLVFHKDHLRRLLRQTAARQG
jgi:hypothetical protein